jgi:hypothetical protein
MSIEISSIPGETEVQNIETSARAVETTAPAPVIRMFSLKNVWRLSVAAMISGIIGISAYLYYQQDTPTTLTAQVNIVDELPKVSEDDMTHFLLSVPDMTQTETLPMAGLDNLNIEDMLKDVQDSELQDYVKEMPDLQPEKLN